MRKRSLMVLMIALFLFLLIFIRSNGKDAPSNGNVSNFSAEHTDNKLTWKEYQSIFSHIVDNISVEGLEVKASTLGDNVTAVDKELTFNKREYLTVDGTFNNLNMKPTEEQIILENDNQDKQLTITIMYTNNYIDENLIGYPTNAGFDNLNEDLVKKAEYSILTYKNLVIVVHQLSVDKYDSDLTYKIMKSLVDLLTEY